MGPESAQSMSPQAQPGFSSSQGTSSTETPQALKTWWAGFKHKRKKEEPREPLPQAPGIFGIPLADSIRYANVAISLVDDQGKSFTYGYVPIIVAKCGVFLKEKATDVEGIFRLSGSAKRIKELQTAFDSPDRYGKGLDWTGYTVHDAANVLRRYLNNLPQPIVPLEFYEQFREPLRHHFNQPGNDNTVMDTSLDFDHDTAIVTYQQLITEIPPLNRQLLLYILDLLAVFASKSDVNLMTSANLAAIFQPGVLSHPIHDMSPEAYRLSQDVLIFLIDNQDSFLIGMSGTAADEKTVRDVQSGAIPQQPSTPSKSGLVESVSNASIAGEGKRYSGIRRNVSTSSRNSRQSSQGLSTPLVGHFNNSVVHRSNTVPSKKSPAIPTTRFNRGIDSPNSPLAQSPAIGGPLTRANAVTTAGTQEEDQSMNAKPVIEGLGLNQPALPSASGLVANDSRDKSRTTENNNTATGTLTQLLPLTTMNRKVSDVLLNLTGGSDKDGRQPNKLKKKRLPSNLNASGNSSAASLVGGEPSPAFPSTRSPLRTPDISASDRTDPLVTTTTNLADLSLLANESEPQTPIPTSSNAPLFSNSEASGTLKTPVMSEHAQTLTDPALMARSASRTSAHSKSSVTDLSELDHDQTDQARAEHKEKRRIWRFSHSANKSKSPARVSNNTGAGQSSSSVGSWHRSRKSISNDTNPSAFEPVPSMPTASTVLAVTGSKARSRSRDQDNDGDTEEKQGFFDKLKKKVNQVREDKKERDAEKERAKSPMRETEQSSKPSLPAIVNESTSPIRPSVVQQTIPETRESDNTITEVAMVQKTEPRESKSTNVEPASLPPIIIPPPTVSPSTPIATTEPNTSIQTQVSTTGTQTSDLVLMKDVSTATETATSLTTAPTTSSDQP